MVAHVDDNEGGHLDKVDSEIGICKDDVSRVLARVVLVNV